MPPRSRAAGDSAKSPPRRCAYFAVVYAVSVNNTEIAYDLSALIRMEEERVEERERDRASDEGEGGGEKRKRDLSASSSSKCGFYCGAKLCIRTTPFNRRVIDDFCYRDNLLTVSLIVRPRTPIIDVAAIVRRDVSHFMPRRLYRAHITTGYN